MRTFVAIELPKDIRDGLGRISRDLKSLKLDGRGTRIEGIHLTLKFLGEVAEDRIPKIQEALLASKVDSSPFELQVRRVGVFPHLARPRVIWVGIEESEPLKVLQAKVEESLAGLGFAVETRPFTPHLTLMRLRSPKNLPRLIRFIRDYPNEPLGVVPVSNFHLYQSILHPDGAQYRKLITVSL